MTQTDRDTTQLLNQLIARFLSKSNLPEPERAEKAKQLLLYSVRLLGCGPRSTIYDEASIVTSLKRDLDVRKGEQAAARFQDEYQKLVGRSHYSQQTRCGLLHLLHQCLKDRPAESGKSAIPSAMSYLASINMGGLPYIPGQANSVRQTAQRTQPGPPAYTVTFPSSNTVSAEPSRAVSMSGSVLQDSIDLGTKTFLRQEMGMNSSWEDAGTFTVKEPLLVKDVLYASQGINGKFTMSQGGGDGSFSIAPQADIPGVDRMLITRLTELGYLFRKVKQHIAGSSDELGAMHQALCAALSQELNDFYRLMAVLETQSNQPIPVPGGDAEPTGPYLTLRRLNVWLGEPLRRMRLLAQLVDGTDGLTGGALAGAVYELSRNGDPFISAYVSRILNAVCVPLFGMIRKWVFEGVLEDPHGEFFVQAVAHPRINAAVAKEQYGDLWRHGYVINEANLPPFLSGQLANKILRAGKSINFLQECCGDVKWVHDRVVANAAAASNVGLAQVEALDRFVSDASAEVDKRLMETLSSRFHLAKHCDAVRRYLLLAQGDFVQALMDLVQGELAKDADSVSEITLMHCLRTAINNSNAKYDDEDVTDRLKARKQKAAGQGEQGWDVFSLSYEVRGPLSALFTPEAMMRYLRVFQLLWCMKRVEHGLAASWKIMKCEIEKTAARFTDGKSVNEVVRKALRLRTEMSHFCTNLQYYYMSEVLEAAWRDFNKRAASAADLDQLIAAHDEYLSTVLRKALLEEGGDALRVTLNELLDNMLTVHGVVQRFNEVVQGVDRAIQQQKRQVASRNAKGQWGAGAGEHSIEGVPAEQLVPILRDVEELYRHHNRALAKFTEQLPAQTHEEVRFLLLRLDFAEVYRRRALQTEDEDDGMDVDM
mmetsp:Transcript_8944/g.19114  ORF Transcript_8944/g.19114 Transcript_8944/m.19114 type:complete len:880 (+) Transcript_8944:124-2763(+)|eukprot:CAMPEP_0202910476 /NCGR_PEP_ID=MMETSP1392-20130828/52161_1 /ASSEMBLY_ACC=CAM_ASM_000868 /TAXON_ID=225041 /ORGANISM="Chlamydomonas chlamydogama, Strain SAG 11-48b" /LENGTH=879 /DNA_ID=CAMNT_0049600603 /DNA_START=81 /DNA_END=2720 /DNA_ORIENTATION=-